MAESPKSTLQKRFKILLKSRLELNILAPNRCDQATTDFNNFLDTDLKKNQLKFSEFDLKVTRLDHFYFKIVDVGKYEVLSFILRLMFTMSHRQATAQRGY